MTSTSALSALSALSAPPLWDSNILIQSLQRGHDEHLSSSHLEIQSSNMSTIVNSNLQIARTTTIEAARRVLMEDMRTRQSRYCIVPAIENGLEVHIRSFAAVQLSCEPYILASKPMSFHTKNLERTSKSYQTEGMEKILQTICRQPLGKECR